MLKQNGYAQYQNCRIMTASPAELTLMLYEGAIKFCNIAQMAMEKKDYEKANVNMQKARNIIVELQTTLNFDYPVAKDFDIIYSFIFERMTAANISKDPAVVDEILVQLRELRDIWRQVMKGAKDPRL